MSEQDERVARIQSAYEEAVKKGEIDPKQTDIEKFADMTASEEPDTLDYFSGSSKDLREEEKNSERAVAHLQSKTGKLRQSILDKWFGKSNEDND